MDDMVEAAKPIPVDALKRIVSSDSHIEVPDDDDAGLWAPE
jgi:hypothetical protein